MERASLAVLIESRNRQLTLWLFVPICITYCLLQFFLFSHSLRTAKQEVIQWRDEYRDRITHDLFLQNTADLSDLVKTHDFLQKQTGQRLSFFVLDLKKRVLAPQKANLPIANYIFNEEQTQIHFRTGRVFDFTELKLGETKLGFLLVESQYSWFQLLKQSVLVLGACLVLFSLMKLGVLLLIKVLNQSVVDPLSKISSELALQDANPSQLKELAIENKEFALAPKEIEGLIKSFNDLLSRVKWLQKKEQELIVNKTKVEISAQLAHDIRSPMAALSLALENATELPAEKRELFVQVLQRMGDMGEQLLKTHQGPVMTKPEKPTEEPLATKLAFKPIFDSIVAEKQALLLKQKKIALCTVKLEEVFVLAEANGLKRVLSNLIDNAIESMVNSGQISFKTKSSQGIYYFSVCDNGRGMTKEQIQQAWSPGITFNKPNGTGIGLSFVKYTVESWNGRAVIDSAQNKGTVVTIQLKIAE